VPEERWLNGSNSRIEAISSPSNSIRIGFSRPKE